MQVMKATPARGYGHIIMKSHGIGESALSAENDARCLAIAVPVLVGAAFLLFGLAPMAHAKDTQIVSPNVGFAKAMSRCASQQGPGGDALGDIYIDPATGAATYRCDSDPVGETMSLTTLPVEPEPEVTPEAETTHVDASNVAETQNVAVTDSGVGTGSAASLTLADASDAVDDGVRSDIAEGPKVWVRSEGSLKPLSPEDCIGADMQTLRLRACRSAMRMGLIPTPVARR